ncbi:MAG: GspH/FimT family pseudopilin [Acidiferrobacter sp.]
MAAVKAAGFTLFEILVILALIGIMLGIVAPRLSRDVGVSARHEGLRLVALLKAARMQAIVTGKPYRVVFHKHGYAFLTLNGRGRFVPAHSAILRARRLPVGASLTDLGKGRGVVFSPSGLSHAFRVEVVTQRSHFLLRGDSNGHITGLAQS